MRLQLLDLVKVVSTLPFEIVRVTGTEGVVTLQSRLQDDSNGAVIFQGKLKNQMEDFEGIFGLSNISMLVGITNLEAFKDKDAKITLKRLERNGVKIPEEIVFEKDGFGKASYRLAGEKAVPAQMSQKRQITWDVEIENPVKSKVAQFTQIAGIYSGQETKFSIKTEGTNLKFLIGDENAATHKAQVIFADNVKGTVKPNFTWSIAGIINVLKLGLNSDMKVRISNEGILQIDIDTGVGEYSYIFAGAK